MTRYLLPLMLPLLVWSQNSNSLSIHHGVRFTSFTMSTQNGFFGPHGDLLDFYAQSVGLEYLGAVRKGRWSLDLDL
ncbi:MAG: hypothetical protein EBY63_02520 [Flavobacteriia bacterium]|nr:hypothetical protein [Flavobacteriia bacterium]